MNSLLLKLEMSPCNGIKEKTDCCFFFFFLRMKEKYENGTMVHFVFMYIH